MKLPLPACENCELVRFIDKANAAIELNAALENAYSVLGIGLVFFRSDKKVIYVNDRAKNYLKLTDKDIDIGLDNIRTHFDKSCHLEIKDAGDRFLSGIAGDRDFVIATIDGERLLITFEWLDQSLLDSDLPGFSMLISSSKENGEIEPNVVARLLCLTKAEARLAVALVNGMTATEYSALHNLSINTVYSQIKSMLAKTGVRRQAELVKLVLERTINNHH